MLKTLIRKQLLELFYTYTINSKTGKKRTGWGLVSYIILLIALFGGLGFAFYSMAGGLGFAILGHGINWLYFALMSLLSMALGIFGSVFNTYASLYLPKDNEFLLTLPIPARTMLAARVSGVYVVSLMYSAWIWIPVTIAYWNIEPVTLCGVLFPVLLTFVIALFVTVLSCILGWLVALVAVRAKGKSFLTVILSLTVMGLYYVIYFKIVGSLGEVLQHLDQLGSFVKGKLGYVYLLGQAADGKAMPLLLTILITVALALLCYLVMERTFSSLVRSESKTEKKSVKEESYRQNTLARTLLAREFKQFTSQPSWMLNGGLGLILMPAAAIVLVIKREYVQNMLGWMNDEMPEMTVFLPVVILLLFGMLITTNAILPVSVSIEGKSMWILQSLPIDPWEILKAKEQMGVKLNLYPAVLSLMVISFVFGFPTMQLLLMELGLVAFIRMVQALGLLLNLKFPNLGWTNSIIVIKQSMPVFLCLFGGWIVCGALGVGAFFLNSVMSETLILAILVVLFAVTAVLLRMWLKKKGTQILCTLT